MGTGNALNHLPYEAGGGYIAILTSTYDRDKFGFGSNATLPNDARSSWWIYGYNDGCIGDKNKNDLDGTQTVIVHYAQVGVHSPGILLKIKPDALHLPFDNRWGHQFFYKVAIRARIDGSLGTDSVAKIRIWEEMPPSPPTLPIIHNHDGIYGVQSTISNTALTDNSYYLKANDFGGTGYVDLVSPITFRKTVGSSNLFITIEWLNKRNLYVDKIAIYNTFYDSLFLQNSGVQTAIRTSIKNDLNSLFGSVKANTSFVHPYNDEPYPVTYRALGEVSNLSEEKLGTGKYINGATMGLPNDMMMHANSERRPPYIMYDDYTIIHGTDTVSSSAENSIQKAYANLINASAPAWYVIRYSGLKQAIQWAQNFTYDTPNDDVPLYSTIQVQAEKILDNNGNILPDGNRFRAPTYYEILAEGNLSLCYGAKGIMYFCVFTDAPGSGFSYYGLFDEEGNSYDDTNPNNILGLVQNPGENQIPNVRFDSVKKLNQYIDKVKSELLTLTWRNACSIDQGQPTETYISNISSEDAAASTYVELGIFKKSSELLNTNLEHFMVVNRRTLSTESRNITVTFNKSSSYNTWKVTEVGTNNSWIVNKTGSFQTSYQPGEGKLFKFEPFFTGSTETLSGNITSPYNLSIASGKTLNIQSGTTIKFLNGTSIIVNTGASLNAINNNIIFDFVSPGNYNGIKFYSGSSGSLRYCEIKHAYNGVQISGGSHNLSITHCNIHHNNYGLNFEMDAEPISSIQYNDISYNSSYGIYSDLGLSQQIHTNTIVNNGYGIYSYYTDQSIAANTITGNTYGMYLYGSTPDIYDNVSMSGNGEGIRCVDSHPNINFNIMNNNSTGISCTNNSVAYIADNIITSGSIGLKADYSSTLYAAFSNAIYGYIDNYSLYADHNSLIYAANNCWDDYEPYIYSANGSAIYWEPANSPCNQGLLKRSPSEISSTSSAETGSYDKDLVLAFQHILNKKYEEAIVLYVNKLKEAKNFNEKKFSLSQIADCYRKAGKKDFINFLDKEIRKNLSKNDLLYAVTIELENSFNIRERNYDKAIENLDFLISNFSENDDIYKHALFNLVKLSSNYSKNISSAQGYLEELKAKYPDDELTLQCRLLLGEIDSLTAPGKSLAKKTQSIINIPEEYNLLGNYPNPFNPSTTISYALPYQSSVELIIYDIMGREVKTFGNLTQSAGMQSIVWNGTNSNGENVSSGIYIYKIRLTSLENNEVFEKSAKLMMLK